MVMFIGLDDTRLQSICIDVNDTLYFMLNTRMVEIDFALEQAVKTKREGRGVVLLYI
jgi:hypothetical protein